MQTISERIERLLLSERSYFVFAALLVTYNILGTLLLDVVGYSDLWEHLAAIMELSIHPLAPLNPQFGTPSPTHLFTPYHLAWGLAARLIHASPFWLLPAMAGVNTTLFVWGCRALSARVLGDIRYALILALTMLFFWINPWDWSGFYHFALLPLTSTYPYWFALGVILLTVSWIDEERSPASMIGLAAVAALVFLVRPLSGLLLLIACTARLLSLTRIDNRRRIAWLAAPFLGMLLAAVVWPYYPVLKTVLQSQSFSSLGFAGDWYLFYQHPELRLLPALLGAPLLIAQLVRREFTFASVGLAIALSIYTLNGLVFHSPTLSRTVVHVAFFCQLGVVMTLMSLSGKSFWKPAIAAFGTLVVLLALPQAYTSATRIGPLRDVAKGGALGSHSNIHEKLRVDAMGAYFEETSIALAPQSRSWVLPGLAGVRVVASTNPTPFMHDHDARLAAVEEFYDPATTAERRAEIITRWHITHVIVPNEATDVRDALPDHLDVVHVDDIESLYQVN